jgi:hypothetical protein
MFFAILQWRLSVSSHFESIQAADIDSTKAKLSLTTETQQMKGANLIVRFFLTIVMMVLTVASYVKPDLAQFTFFPTIIARWEFEVQYIKARGRVFHKVPFHHNFPTVVRVEVTIRPVVHRPVEHDGTMVFAPYQSTMCDVLWPSNPDCRHISFLSFLLGDDLLPVSVKRHGPIIVVVPLFGKLLIIAL